MSDKHEQAAKKIVMDVRLNSSGQVDRAIEKTSAYLREQFPEPVKIEGMRELAGKILSKAMEVFDSGMECEIADIITDFIQTREAGKWIPVTGGLPRNNHNVLCLCRGGSRIIAWYDEMDKEWFDEGELLRDVTYWQPLPPGPKERI